jgi:hypothetical protein
MRRIIPTLALLLGGLLWWPAMGADRPWPAADRPLHRDDAGVLRWSDTQEEVALFGVNYYTPCVSFITGARRRAIAVE